MIPNEEIVSMFREVQRDMTDHSKSSLSEIFFPKFKGSDIQESGTGTFVDVDGVKILLSNQHVIKNEGLHHSFPKYDRYVRGSYSRYAIDWPIDVGANKISEDTWAMYGEGAVAIPLSRFALKHETCPHEILWTAGYPGARVKQLAATYCVAQMLPTQEYIFRDEDVPHELFNQLYHFALAYSPEKAKSINESTVSTSPGLSSPPGLSGSLVWNTRRLQCFYERRTWNPSMALVTGIIWGWPSRDYLIATKVEHFRGFLTYVSQLPSTPGM